MTILEIKLNNITVHVSSFKINPSTIENDCWIGIRLTLYNNQFQFGKYGGSGRFMTHIDFFKENDKYSSISYLLSKNIMTDLVNNNIVIKTDNSIYLTSIVLLQLI